MKGTPVKYISILLMTLLIATGCTGQAPLDDTKGQNTRIAEAVEATIAAATDQTAVAQTETAPTETPVPTASPTAEITPTPQPTPTLTPSPTYEPIPVPADWQQYTTITDMVTYAHPPSWRVSNEQRYGAIFDVGGDVCAVAVVMENCQVCSSPVDSAEVLNCLVENAHDSEFRSGDFRLLRKDFWAVGSRHGYMLEYVEDDRNHTHYTYNLYAPLSPGWMLYVLRTSTDKEALTNNEYEILDTVAGSLQLLQIPEAESTPDPEQTASAPHDADEDDSDGHSVELTDWTWYTSGSGNYVYVDGMLTNISSRPMCYVEIHIATYDEEKNLLSTDWTYVDMDYIAPGGSTTFKVMTRKPPRIEWVEITNIQWEWAD